MLARLTSAAILLGAGACSAPSSNLLAPPAAESAAAEGEVSLIYNQPLPNVPGKSIRAVVVEYPPGGSSPAHTHPSSAFIYATVMEGAIKSGVNDGPIATYRAGESFSEFPGDRHSVSANASTTESARLFAIFVLDSNETTLTTPLDPRQSAMTAQERAP